jgi:hypothetical protein
VTFFLDDELQDDPKAMKSSIKARNKRIAPVYFTSSEDLKRARRAARRVGVTLTAFLRDAVNERTGKVLAA